VSRLTFQFAFYGFCCLSALLVGYLWDRQITIRRLTQQAQTDNRRNSIFRLRACNDLLNTIPGIVGFREHLTAHSHQAGASSKPALLSVAVVRLYLSGMISDKSEEQAAFGDAAQVIQRRLRSTDSIFVLSSGMYGIILRAWIRRAFSGSLPAWNWGSRTLPGWTADLQRISRC